MSTARIYTAHGQSLTMRQWAKELELPQKTLRNRLGRGWTLEATFTPGKQLHRGVQQVRAALTTRESGTGCWWSTTVSDRGRMGRNGSACATAARRGWCWRRI
jgi:hypothetical protein